MEKVQRLSTFRVHWIFRHYSFAWFPSLCTFHRPPYTLFQLHFLIATWNRQSWRQSSTSIRSHTKWRFAWSFSMRATATNWHANQLWIFMSHSFNYFVHNANAGTSHHLAIWSNWTLTNRLNEMEMKKNLFVSLNVCCVDYACADCREIRRRNEIESDFTSLWFSSHLKSKIDF